MVYFNCEGCGNGLRKNQVEQHMYACKSRVFSCIDCNKNFRNDEYKSHVKCITESEKYESKSSYVAKANKGELKQNAWLEKVNQAVQTFRGSQRAKILLEKLIDFPNIPRKKVKFFNFAQNSFRSFGVNESLLNEIWEVIESFDKIPPKAAIIKPAPDLKRKSEDTNTQQTEKKIKQSEQEQEDFQCQDETNKFDWIDLIRNELMKKEKYQVSLSKLSKKVLKKYKKLEINADCDQQHLELHFNKKLIKKLKKNSNLFDLQSTTITTSDGNNGDATKTTLINVSSDFESILVKLKEK